MRSGPELIGLDYTGTLLVVPSISFPVAELAKITAVGFYEERMLFLLLLLRNPALRVVFVTSSPVDPAIVDYYLRFVPAGRPGPADHGRPWAIRRSAACRTRSWPGPTWSARLRELVPEGSTMLPFNVTPAEAKLAVALGVTAVRAAAPPGPAGVEVGRPQGGDAGRRGPHRGGGEPVLAGGGGGGHLGHPPAPARRRGGGRQARQRVLGHRQRHPGAGRAGRPAAGVEDHVLRRRRVVAHLRGQGGGRGGDRRGAAAGAEPAVAQRAAADRPRRRGGGALHPRPDPGRAREPGVHRLPLPGRRRLPAGHRGRGPAGGRGAWPARA